VRDNHCGREVSHPAQTRHTRVTGSSLRSSHDDESGDDESGDTVGRGDRR
jgi:hypothetical protein